MRGVCVCLHVCSAQSKYLRNLEIVFCVFRIHDKAQSLQILHTQSRYQTFAISRLRKCLMQCRNWQVISRMCNAIPRLRKFLD